jgi:hypothetical protein
MALPLIPLATRAALSLAKNKKAREALTKPVGQFFKNRSAVNKAVDVGTAGVAGFGAGVAATNEYNNSKKAKKVVNQPKTATPKMKPKKYR